MGNKKEVRCRCGHEKIKHCYEDPAMCVRVENHCMVCECHQFSPIKRGVRNERDKV